MAASSILIPFLLSLVLAPQVKIFSSKWKWEWMKASNLIINFTFACHFIPLSTCHSFTNLKSEFRSVTKAWSATREWSGGCWPAFIHSVIYFKFRNEGKRQPACTNGMERNKILILWSEMEWSAREAIGLCGWMPHSFSFHFIWIPALLRSQHFISLIILTLNCWSKAEAILNSEA